LWRSAVRLKFHSKFVMASRRVATTAVDWAALSARIPKTRTESDAFRAFKTKCDLLVANVHKYPESLPAIDWSLYKSRIAMPGLVDAFEKAYGDVSVPYPADPDNLKAKLDTQEAEAAETVKERVAALQKQIGISQALLNIVKSIPDPDVMTQEMYAEYFPYQARNPEQPSFFPHTHREQPFANPEDINYKPGSKAHEKYDTGADKEAAMRQLTMRLPCK